MSVKIYNAVNIYTRELKSFDSGMALKTFLESTKDWRERTL